MKILYGVQATGNGHITRARALAPELANAGIEVDYVFSGRAREKFFDMEPFGDWACYRGLTFIHDAGALSITKTLKHNNLLTVRNDIKNLDLSGYDLVITDFEPISAWAAKKQNIRCLGVGHQYAFYHDVPKAGDHWLSRQILQNFAPADITLGLHWHHFGTPVLPPIAEVHETDLPTDPQKIVVYLGFESHDDIMQLIEPFDDYVFVVYGPYSSYQQYDHIQLKPLSREGFKQDLATAGGVICNAGFELASEAIQLGKKLLVKPLHGQMEQLSNAVALEQLGLGMAMQSLDRARARQWLANFKSERVIYPNVAQAIAQWIQTSGLHNRPLKDLEESPKALAARLWCEV